MNIFVVPIVFCCSLTQALVLFPRKGVYEYKTEKIVSKTYLYLAEILEPQPEIKGDCDL